MDANSGLNRSKRNRRLCCLASLLTLVGLLVVCHRPLLRAIGKGLVVDQSPTRVDAVVIFGGDGRYRTAAAKLEGGTADRILLLESSPTRLTELGIIEKQSEVAQRKLIGLGVPRKKISIVGGDSTGDWGGARIIRQWLAGHPGASVAVLSDRFGSRWARYSLDQVLSDSDRRRVYVVALRDRRYDESNWWLQRTGWKQIFNGYLALGYAVFCGEDQCPQPALHPDQFEEQLIQQWNAQQE